MKKLLPLIFSAAFFAACGGDSRDAAVGATLDAETIEVESSDVEVFCVVDEDAGIFSRQKDSAEATVGINNTGGNPQRPAAVRLTSYDVEYFPLDNGPNLDPHFGLPVAIYIEGGGEAAFNVEFVPISTKQEFFDDVTGTTKYGDPFMYEAQYTFYGETQFQEPVQAEPVSITFTLGFFNEPCE